MTVDIRTGFQPPVDGEVIGASQLRYDAFLRWVKELKGLGGAEGKAVVFADQYEGVDMVAKIIAAITSVYEVYGGGVVVVIPGIHISPTILAPVQAAPKVTVMGLGYYLGQYGMPPTILQQSTSTYIVNLLTKGSIAFCGLGFQYSHPQSGIVMRGYNSGAVYLHQCYLYGGYNGPEVLKVEQNANGWDIRDTFIGRYNNGVNGHAVVFDNAYDCHLKRVRGTVNGHGVKITGTGSAGVYNKDFSFEECMFGPAMYQANQRDAYYIDAVNVGRIEWDKCKQLSAHANYGANARYAINVVSTPVDTLKIFHGKFYGQTAAFNDKSKFVMDVVGIE